MKFINLSRWNWQFFNLYVFEWFFVNFFTCWWTFIIFFHFLKKNWSYTNTSSHHITSNLLIKTYFYIGPICAILKLIFGGSESNDSVAAYYKNFIMNRVFNKDLLLLFHLFGKFFYDFETFPAQSMCITIFFFFLFSKKLLKDGKRCYI